MKSRRVSLGVKMYAFFIAVIMIVSGVLLVMSVRAFRDAVIVPLSEKLKAAEPLDKELRDYMEYFLTYLGTDELREIQRNTKPDKDTLIDWLEKQPSQEEKRADGSQNTSMLVDAASSYFTLNRFRGHLKADYAWIEIVKDGAPVIALRLSISGVVAFAFERSKSTVAPSYAETIAPFASCKCPPRTAPFSRYTSPPDETFTSSARPVLDTCMMLYASSVTLLARP